MADMSQTLRAGLLQRLSCRRRQSASPDHLRRHEGRASSSRAEAFGADILRLCVKVGGVLTGEHGVGVEKRDLMTEHVRAKPIWNSSTGSNAPSMPAACSIPARCFRPCRPVSSRAICMSMAPSCRIPICRASDEQGHHSEEQVVDFVRARARTRAPFEIVAGGTRRGVGKPMRATSCRCWMSRAFPASSNMSRRS